MHTPTHDFKRTTVLTTVEIPNVGQQDGSVDKMCLLSTPGHLSLICEMHMRVMGKASSTNQLHMVHMYTKACVSELIKHMYMH